MGVLFTAVDGFGLKEMATRLAFASEEEREVIYRACEGVMAIDNALFCAMMILFGGFTPLFYGLAFVRATDTVPFWAAPHWLGWFVTVNGVLGIVGGLMYSGIFFGGGVQSTAGPQDLSFHTSFTASISVFSIISVGAIGMGGVWMWRELTRQLKKLPAPPIESSDA